MHSLSKVGGIGPRSWISLLAVVVVVFGAAGVGVLLLAPMEAIHAKPKPAIEYTASEAPLIPRGPAPEADSHS